MGWEDVDRDECERLGLSTGSAKPLQPGGKGLAPDPEELRKAVEKVGFDFLDDLI